MATPMATESGGTVYDAEGWRCDRVSVCSAERKSLFDRSWLFREFLSVDSMSEEESRAEDIGLVDLL